MLWQILACVLAADVITGLVHWWEGTYGDPDWPLLGREVIRPNLVHHEKPTLFVTMGDAWTRNYQLIGLACGATLVATLAGYSTWQLLLTVWLAAAGNEVHAWAHVRPRSRLARWLQETALVQTPHQHAKHHRAPYDSNYCTLTNVANPVLEALRFWRRLEAVIAFTTGIKPLRGTAKRGGF